ncbi:MAG: hypothetical protein ACK4V9_15090 [Aphanizomenon sp.]|jgi:exodeoxyribonuclease VII large subunit|uniref:Uncharacterized protein n=1 Tax=Aphanizomenon flos-aquae LD13 TaxID=1710894 RepID=A0A1B7VH59_APHFL|nr:MAG: hypothetical protein AN481_18865 [Aphanizomenon flos-aquae LD13]OBQ27647.1 MAG: hypothetical protein AN483_19630 [Aphanizomenon flos-aquae MDT14a]
MTFNFPNTALSVTRLIDYLKLLLEQHEILEEVWVTGEVSSTNHQQSELFLTVFIVKAIERVKKEQKY